MQEIICLLLNGLAWFALFFAAFIIVLFATIRRGEAPQVFVDGVPPHRLGVWLMAHRASRSYPFQHLFIRITPRDPKIIKKYPQLFTWRDAKGHAYATLGAGPLADKLRLEFNRQPDLRDPISYEAPGAMVDEKIENRLIEALLADARAYDQERPFTTWSPFGGKGYNCNALISALLARQGLHPATFARPLLRCAGLYRPVPNKYFSREKRELALWARARRVHN